MSGYIVLPLFVMLLGSVNVVYQIYKMTVMDARSRGLKHPRWWGIFASAGGNNSSGLLIYLLGRKKYPSEMSEAVQKEMNSRKQRAFVGLAFLAAGAIGVLGMIIFM